MKALVDGDILLYSIGSATDDEGHPLSWPLTLARLDGKIKQIVREAGADEYVVYITGEDNFRVKEATIKPYKGHRTAPKPHHYDRIKQYFSSTKNHEVIFVDGYEADDAMAIEQYKDRERFALAKDRDVTHSEYGKTIICSKDKDLDMVPGMHYKWHDGSKKKIDPYFVSEIEGWRWFFKQLLMGDPVDNIPGLFGVGNKSKLVEDLDKIGDELEMYTHVQKKYEDRFGSYWRMFLEENARLLWMLRFPTDDIRLTLQTFHDSLEEKKNDEMDY